VSWRLWVEFRSALRPVPIVLALVLSFALIGLLTIMSSFGHGPDYYYGAPVPVGTGDYDLLAGELGPGTFSPLIFALDVVLTAAVLLFAGRRTPSLGVLVAAVSAFGALLLVFLMFFKNADYVGFPIPVSMRSRPPLPEAVLVWIDMMIWAFAAGIIVGRRASRTAAIGAGLR